MEDDPEKSGIYPAIPQEAPVEEDKGGLTVMFCIAVGVIAICVILAGCGEVREEQKQEVKREVQVEQTITKTAPVIADTPVGQITIQPSQVTVERRQTTEATTDTKGHGEVKYDPTPPPAVTSLGTSLLGLIPGVGGLGAALLAFLSRQKAVGALKATVTAIDEFKDDSEDGHTVEKLHNCLSRHMDKKHKDLIRKIKR